MEFGKKTGLTTAFVGIVPAIFVSGGMGYHTGRAKYGDTPFTTGSEKLGFALTYVFVAVIVLCYYWHKEFRSRTLQVVTSGQNQGLPVSAVGAGVAGGIFGLVQGAAYGFLMALALAIVLGEILFWFLVPWVILFFVAGD
ncbi:MAG: hypothetical protein ACHQUB_01290 [Candidatus Saccharimonadia bacterium]